MKTTYGWIAILLFCLAAPLTTVQSATTSQTPPPAILAQDQDDLFTPSENNFDSLNEFHRLGLYMLIIVLIGLTVWVLTS